MKKNNILFVMCGLPASGKTTLAEYLAKELDCVVVSTDKMRAVLYGDESIQGNGKEVFDLAYEQAELWGLRGDNVVFDATQLTKRARKQTLDRLSHLFGKCVCVFADTPFEVCMERNKARDRVIPVSVMRRMALQLQEPTVEEGFKFVERHFSCL